MANNIDIVKFSGEIVKFAPDKLKASLRRSGANENIIDEIMEIIQKELYAGISTKEIYNRAFSLLKKRKSYLASKYKLKKAIYELGPTGFPFERFIGAVLEHSGYQIESGITILGHCVKHEVDVLAHKDNEIKIVECKFHSEQGLKCNVTIPLYINSRYNDIRQQWDKSSKYKTVLTKGWVVTNTRFTEDAIKYGNCCGLYLLSWDFPKNEGLKDRIDRLSLYPITVSTLLSSREKHFLLERNVVLCKDLLRDAFFLEHLGISENRRNRILSEIKSLCDK